MTDVGLYTGKVLHGSYRLIEPLGKGGMGVVWRAAHLRLPKDVAIKVLNESSSADETSLKRFQQEAEITSRLRHPHIVTVFDFNVLEDGRAYIVMELLRGENLRERLKRGPLSVDETVTLVRQVGLAVSCAHDAGVVHRDLKPENVFLCEPEDSSDKIQAKVLDFGVSKIQGQQTLATDNYLLGTPYYMSPEQVSGSVPVGPQADQFALAAIAYEAVTGHVAFFADNVPSVLFKVVYEQPAPIEKYVGTPPVSLVQALAKALDKQPDHRFATMKYFVEAAGSTNIVELPQGDIPTRRLMVGEVSSSPWSSGIYTYIFAILSIVSVFIVSFVVFKTIKPSRPKVLIEPISDETPSFDAKSSKFSQNVEYIDSEDFDAGVLSLDIGVPLYVELSFDAGLVSVDGDVGALDSSIESERRINPLVLGRYTRRARQSIKSGKYREAIRQARLAIRKGERPGADVYLVVSHCGERDLESANAMFRRVPKHLKAMTVQACLDLGLKLSH